MKAFIRGEVFNDSVRQEMQLCAKIVNMAVPGYGSWFFHCPSNTWAAEITGFDKKYKYRREFLNGKRDYTYGNGKGTRGIYLEWVLESGHVYEIKRQVSWSSAERFFCTVDGSGNIVKLTEKEVYKMLKKSINEMTDSELLDLVDCPEEEIPAHVSARAIGISDENMNAPEMADIILGELERRHGDDEANRLWEERFGD